MKDTYEINQETLIIKLDSKKRTFIITKNKNFNAKEEIINIINDSCCYYGSSYLGRLEGSKNILNSTIKSPIIIEDTNGIIFFPTKSPRLKDCIWISYNNIEKYKEKNKKVIIFFKGSKVIELDVSFYIINNQINRCLRLEKEINKRRKKM